MTQPLNAQPSHSAHSLLAQRFATKPRFPSLCICPLYTLSPGTALSTLSSGQRHTAKSNLNKPLALPSVSALPLCPSTLSPAPTSQLSTRPTHSARSTCSTQPSWPYLPFLRLPLSVSAHPQPSAASQSSQLNAQSVTDTHSLPSIGQPQRAAQATGVPPHALCHSPSQSNAQPATERHTHTHTNSHSLSLSPQSASAPGLSLSPERHPASARSQPQPQAPLSISCATYSR